MSVSLTATPTTPIHGKISSFLRSETCLTLNKALFVAGISTGIIFKASSTIVLPFVLVPVPTLLVVGGIGFGIIALEVYRLRHQLLFEISLAYTIFKAKPWWTEIASNIVLGALPLQHQLKQFQNIKIGAVLTLMEPFAQKKGLVEPIDSKTWTAAGITQKHIHAQDYIGVPPKQIEAGVEFLREQLMQNKRVYVHCKAGRGRSATIVVAYLLRYGLKERTFQDLQDAYRFVKEQRDINLNIKQQQTIRDWLINFSPPNS